MSNDIHIYIVSMPPKIKGYTEQNADGSYTILISEHLSSEARMKTYRHELSHIERSDFTSESSVDKIELESHGLATAVQQAEKLSPADLRRKYPNAYRYYDRMKRRYKKERKELLARVEFEQMMLGL